MVREFVWVEIADWGGSYFFIKIRTSPFAEISGLLAGLVSRLLISSLKNRHFQDWITAHVLFTDSKAG